MDVRVKVGMERRFIELTSNLQADVRANEKGCVFYQVLQRDDDPLQFAFVEIFADETAYAAHPDMPYHRAMSEAGWACVEGRPEIRQFKLVDKLPKQTSVHV